MQRATRYSSWFHGSHRYTEHLTTFAPVQADQRFGSRARGFREEVFTYVAFENLVKKHLAVLVLVLAILVSDWFSRYTPPSSPNPTPENLHLVLDGVRLGVKACPLTIHG